MYEETYDENCEHLPLIGDVAPYFSANTTTGPINFPIDFRGRWVVLFSHPMDFTPVCTTEFLAFQSMLHEFQELDTELIGLSVGAISSHLAWFRSIYDEIDFNNWKNVDITFPVIADIDLHVSKLYGMIHPNTSDTKTVRAVFIIDPKSIIRTILYYPQTTGRNMKEIKRILIALQTNDAFKVSTPADWTPGQPVIAPSPQNIQDLQKRLNNHNKNIDVQSWYLAFRDLPENKIYEKIKKKKS
ncbi:MAG: peroxiredoxin [Alphaproteobacteria bacterium]|nr:peroxiredoxin [Alphaproteobacteria bacterium]